MATFPYLKQLGAKIVAYVLSVLVVLLLFCRQVCQIETQAHVSGKLRLQVLGTQSGKGSAIGRAHSSGIPRLVTSAGWEGTAVKSMGTDTIRRCPFFLQFSAFRQRVAGRATRDKAHGGYTTVGFFGG